MVQGRQLLTEMNAPREKELLKMLEKGNLQCVFRQELARREALVALSPLELLCVVKRTELIQERAKDPSCTVPEWPDVANVGSSCSTTSECCMIRYNFHGLYH